MTLPREPFGFTIFCDDLRQEVGGKVSMIGVYSETMIFESAAPAVLARLVLATTYVEPRGFDELPVSLRVVAPGHAEPILMAPVLPAGPRTVMSALETPDAAEIPNYMLARFTIPLMNLFLPEPGRLGVEYVRGDSVVRGGSLLVGFNPPTETAAAPASGTS